MALNYPTPIRYKQFINMYESVENNKIYFPSDSIGIFIISKKEKKCLSGIIERNYVINSMDYIIGLSKDIKDDEKKVVILYDKDKFLITKFIVELVYDISKRITNEENIIKKSIESNNKRFIETELNLEEMIIKCGDKKINIEDRKMDVDDLLHYIRIH